MKREDAWTDEDYGYLMDNMDQPAKHVAEFLGGQPYTDEDHKVLSDQDLTLLQKALRLGRSYAAVRSMCMRSGYRSHVGLGDPERDQWKIDNPNAKEYTL